MSPNYCSLHDDDMTAWKEGISHILSLARLLLVSQAKVIYSGGEDVDILAAGASKGKGLEFLLRQVRGVARARPLHSSAAARASSAVIVFANSCQMAVSFEPYTPDWLTSIVPRA